MTITTTADLVANLKKNNYVQVSELLNTTNENLFIGPNNLLNQDTIESATIYTKYIGNWDDVSKIYPRETVDDGINLLDTKPCGSPVSNHMIAIFQLGRNLTSHMHIVHGGAIASLIDEYFVKVALPLTPDDFAVTANLNIKYLRPVKFEEKERIIDVVLDCCVVKAVDGRKFTVVGSLKDLQGRKYCVGELLVAVPRVPL